ncbi:hypothetical protein Rhal01_03669 [Rubritalea halochordaticola]|uniref:DNA polymerase n=1 Tax=Rubritalea halochordaticola TaxID=714537 RepID=A0ABP9V4K9_9BACT
MSGTKHTATRRLHKNVLYVAGRGDTEKADIMFVAPAVHEEEAQEDQGSRFGVRVKEKAEYLKGPIGVLFKDIAMENQIDIVENHYFTAVCKWLLPTQAQRNKPPTKALKWGLPVLQDEIKRVKPKIIVCLGKAAYDMLSPEKISMKDAHGCWIWSEEYEAFLYLMYNPVLLLAKPEVREMFRVDLMEIKRRYDVLMGNPVHTQEVREHVIRTAHELKLWVLDRMTDKDQLFSLDCEWHGSTHVDGDLRSVQLAWNEEDAAYIRFMDDQLNYVFDCTYEEAGRILYPLLGNPKVKYVGHHYAADSVWLQHWLKLPVLGKCYMDTEFAQQTVDEHSELGLERGIAMKYTTLGCYNQDLLMWKRKNKKLCVDGYGYIPDDILIPYGCRDVIAVMRAVPQIRQRMDLQNLSTYYDQIFNPFVTDVFTMFALVGLPMDVPLMDDLRELFNYADRRLTSKFREDIHKEARGLFLRKMMQLSPGIMPGEVCQKMDELFASGNPDAVWDWVKSKVGLDGIKEIDPFFVHLQESPNFNLRSSPSKTRWLFDVCGYTPVKSTNQKAEGRPSMAWEKVLALPEDRQKLYKPAADKQTLMILAQKAPLVDQLLELTMVGNLCKAFLKESTTHIDDDGNTVEDEAGIHKWLASNDRVHGMSSTTATGRPRSWKPNVLNWPSYVNDKIIGNIQKVLKQDYENGTLPESLVQRWKDVIEAGEDDKVSLPSIRSCVAAPEGYVLLDEFLF